ncbi:MAG: EAL domain-containing protein [Spirochaetales bacterium]|nr:EAL domain-containing protein [Spirochaetales bacterium]
MRGKRSFSHDRSSLTLVVSALLAAGLAACGVGLVLGLPWGPGWAEIFVLALLGILLELGAIFLLGRRKKRQLQNLVKAAKRLQEGDFNPDLDTQPQNDLGLVAKGLRFLLDRFQHNQLEQENLLDELRHQAYHDELTGLPNRKFFVERLLAHFQLASRLSSSNVTALLLVNVDHFKAVNDTLGFSVGDKVLQIVTQRVKNQIRQTDELFRLEADGFAVLASALSHGEDAALVAQKILTALEAPFQVGERLVHLTASIGISRLPQDGFNSAEVYKNAETALSEAQKERGTFRFFTMDMQYRAQERLQTITRLHAAVRAKAFEAFYQVQVDPRGKILGAEVLARWKTSDGYILPDHFITIAEETNLILPLGRQMLEAAASFLAKLREMGLTDLELWVNLSVRQLQSEGFDQTLDKIVRNWNVSPRVLKFEITEGALAEEARALKQIQTLRNQGFSFAVDDFGTGYSSLNRIKILPVDILKIDRSFVAGLADKKVDRDLVEAIVTLAHDMGLKVVAEGVENIAQKLILDELGCDVYQGNLFGEPLNESDFLKVLKAL